MDIQYRVKELLDLVAVTRIESICESSEVYSREDIESAIKIRPVPEELSSIYLCVGGDYSVFDCFSGLIPAYDLIELESINRVIDMFQCIRSEIIERYGDGGSSSNWEPDMIPFLFDGSGYYICVRTLLDDNSVWVIPKALNCRKINTNLDRFILTAIECYRQEAYYLDEDDGIWDTDLALSKEIVRSIDPEIENYFPP
jgi:SMI1 / KNR4 family (SUKH-1)